MGRVWPTRAAVAAQNKHAQSQPMDGGGTFKGWGQSKFIP